jgi:ribosomal protein L6P/L9E
MLCVVATFFYENDFLCQSYRLMVLQSVISHVKNLITGVTKGFQVCLHHTKTVFVFAVLNLAAVLFFIERF